MTTRRMILFGLDDTLIVEEASAEAVFLAICEQVRQLLWIWPQIAIATLPTT